MARNGCTSRWHVARNRFNEERSAAVATFHQIAQEWKNAAPDAMLSPGCFQGDPEILPWKMAIEIVDFPIKDGDFPLDGCVWK